MTSPFFLRALRAFVFNRPMPAANPLRCKRKIGQPYRATRPQETRSCSRPTSMLLESYTASCCGQDTEDYNKAPPESCRIVVDPEPFLSHPEWFLSCF